MAYHRIYGQKLQQTNRKLNELRHRAYKRNTPTLNHKAILNKTTKSIPCEAELILSLSPKFALPYHNIKQQPLYHLIAETENIIKLHPDKRTQESVRCSITNTIHNHINSLSKQNSDPDSKFLIQAYKTTAKFVKNNPDICVLTADKGNRTVIMWMKEYDDKMNNLLSDANTYTPIRSDPTLKYQKFNNNLIKRMLDLKLIDNHTANTLKTTVSTCPRIYGQPKAHKPDLPLRPVVPGITAPSYKLSKYVCKILQMSLNSKYNINSSISFCEYINTITIPQSYVMVSFDVISLFTTIPQQVVIHVIINNWDTIRNNTEINLDLFLEIVSYCMDASYFVFRGQYYQQQNGLAMGSPLSPILADMVMDTLIDTVLNTIDVEIPVIRKYVDDMILLIPENRVTDILNSFNSYHECIQFTCELEQDSKLPYLDMILIRQTDNSIKTQWYSKPMASGRMLNYYSVHPMSQKVNVINNFIYRVKSLSTTLNDDEQRAIIRNQLLQNDYPLGLINRSINRNTWQPQYQRSNDRRNEENNIYRSLPYIPSLTPRISHLLDQINPEIRITPRNNNNVKRLHTRIKDPIPVSHQSNVVYQITCGQCTNTYVGVTGNLLKTRLSGHRSNVNKLESLLQSGLTYTDHSVQVLREQTALLAHCIDHQHRFDFENTKILDKTNKKSALPILEMIWIHNDTRCINKRTDTDGLSNSFSGILHAINTHRQNSDSSTRR